MKKITRNTSNSEILSEYFLNKSINKEQIPTLRIISDETGIDVSVISRYAKRKGFYNFPELRAIFNKSLEAQETNQIDHGLLDFLRKNKSFSIVTSKSTILLGIYIKERLSALGLKATIMPLISTFEDIEETFKFDEGDAIIVTSLSSDSSRVEKFVKQNKQSQIFYITTEEITTANSNLSICILKECRYIKRDSYEVFKTIRKIMNWLDDVMNIYHIEVVNQYLGNKDKK